MENSNNQKQKKDWNKKGLGWIPDYPDLRDYQIGNEEDVKDKLRIKIEERTRDFEKIIEQVINLISELSTRDIQGQKEKIKEFKNQIFGNVLFAKAKVRKFLRTKSDSQDITSIQYPLKKIEYESILENQILELKKYLAVLVMKGYLFPLPIDGNKDDVDFNIEKFLDWMRAKEYDTPTKLLVKDLQFRSEILDDGIVGLETYTAFNEYLSGEKLISLKNCALAITPKKGLTRIKFFAVASLISPTEFKSILNIFRSKIIDQIKEEYKHQRKIFEDDFLKIIEINDKEFKDVFDKLFKNVSINLEAGHVKDDKSFQKIEDSINKIFNSNSKPEDRFPEFSNIETLLQNSHVTEPLFSVMTRLISPLSQWNNQSWEEIILQGFEKFEKIANGEKIANQENDYKNLKQEPGDFEKELVKSAIFQVLSLIKLEIHSFREELAEKSAVVEKAIADEADQSVLEKAIADEAVAQKQYNNVRFLSFLLKKYLNRFADITADAEKNIKNASNQNQELQRNLLDKEEVFEIELISNYESTSGEDEKQEQKKLKELLPSLDLHIPVVISSSYLQEVSTTLKQNKKLYFLLPSVVDLSFWCSPVRDQGSLNSCTAFAAIALLEYFQNRNFGKSTDASPLFLYKAARNKMNVEGDVGASIRETIKVLALFGVPPEQSWPYEEEKVDAEPPPYCYAYAQNYKTLKYFLLDYAGITTESLLFQIKAVLAAGFPCIFGLTLYTSAYEENNSKTGHIPYPDSDKDKVVGGHTAVVVGYDDYKFIRCADRKYYSKGAFLIRNSWGTEWGVNGYGWLPYDYVLAGLTAAWWSLLKAEWFDESNFGSARTGGIPADTNDPKDPPKQQG